MADGPNSKAKGRSAAPNKPISNPLDRLVGFGEGPQVNDPHQFGQCEASMLLDAIAAVLEVGCALVVGATRDGGAVSFTVLQDGSKPRKAYAHSVDEIEKILTSLAA